MEEKEPIKKEKESKKEKEVIKTGRVGFIREGVTIVRDISEANELSKTGWVLK